MFSYFIPILLLYLFIYAFPAVTGFIFFGFQLYLFEKSAKLVIRLVPTVLCAVALSFSIRFMLFPPYAGPFEIIPAISPLILLTANICAFAGIGIAWLLNR